MDEQCVQCVRAWDLGCAKRTAMHTMHGQPVQPELWFIIGWRVSFMRHRINIFRWIEFVYVLSNVCNLDVEFCIERLQLPIGKFRFRNNVHIVCVRSDFFFNEFFSMYL